MGWPSWVRLASSIRPLMLASVWSVGSFAVSTYLSVDSSEIACLILSMLAWWWLSHMKGTSSFRRSHSTDDFSEVGYERRQKLDEPKRRLQFLLAGGCCHVVEIRHLLWVGVHSTCVVLHTKECYRVCFDGVFVSRLWRTSSCSLSSLA